MIPRTITPAEVKVGQTIKITETIGGVFYEATGVVTRAEATWVELGGGSTFPLKDRTITLLAEPAPAILAAETGTLWRDPDTGTLYARVRLPLSSAIARAVTGGGQAGLFEGHPDDEVILPRLVPYHLPITMTTDELIEALTDEQHRRCGYGTREGDGRRCDCKYGLLPWILTPPGAETTGCPELRDAIRVLRGDPR